MTHIQTIRERVEGMKKPEMAFSDDAFGMLGLPPMKPVTLSQLLELEKTIAANKALSEVLSLLNDIEREEEWCCDGECNHDDCCGKIPENCNHITSNKK